MSENAPSEIKRSPRHPLSSRMPATLNYSLLTFKPVPTMSAIVPAGVVPQAKQKEQPPAREPNAPGTNIAIACGLAFLCFVVPSIPQYVRARKLRWFHPENQLLINRTFASVF